MEWADAGEKQYEVKQIDASGQVIDSLSVEADSSEAAAKQLRDVSADTRKISVCVDGKSMSEMGIEYWKKRVRRR